MDCRPAASSLAEMAIEWLRVRGRWTSYPARGVPPCLPGRAWAAWRRHLQLSIRRRASRRSSRSAPIEGLYLAGRSCFPGFGAAPWRQSPAWVPPSLICEELHPRAAAGYDDHVMDSPNRAPVSRRGGGPDPTATGSGGCELANPATPAGYADAQLDDTQGVPAGWLPLEPPGSALGRSPPRANPPALSRHLGLRLLERPLRRLPRIGWRHTPHALHFRAVWFFHASPPNAFGFTSGPTCGWRAMTIDTPTSQAGSLQRWERWRWHNSRRCAQQMCTSPCHAFHPPPEPCSERHRRST